MTKTTRLLPLVALCLMVAAPLLAVGGCASTGPTVPNPGTLPQEASFEGVWYSRQFEHMFLTRTGDEVTGVYAYKNGGKIEGTVEGNLLKFKWVEPGSKEHAIKGQSGHGYLKLVREGDKLELVGKWGYEDDYLGGGPWEAEWVRQLDPADDPTTLEELRETPDSEL